MESTPAADAAPGDGAPASDVHDEPGGPSKPNTADIVAAAIAAAVDTTPASPTAAVEVWRERKATPLIWFQAAFVGCRWCQGLVVSEADYDQAVHAAEHTEMR